MTSRRQHSSLSVHVFILAALSLFLGRANSEAIDIRLVGAGGGYGSTDTSSVLKSISNGLELLTSTLDSGDFFRLGGTRLRLKVQLEDSRDRASQAEAIYRDSVSDGNVSFFLALSDTADIAVSVAQAVNTLAFLPLETSTSIFAGGSRSVFTLSPSTRDFANEALEVVRARGAESIAFLWETDRHNADICAGAKSKAEALGMRVLENSALHEEAVTEQVRHLKVRSPDTLVICGHQQLAEQMLTSSRALAFVPKAFVITSAALPAFVHSVGPANANYIIAPVLWYPELDWPCSVFGSATAFGEAYLQRFGDRPTFHSAAAVATGITLLSAIQAAGSASVEHVRDALLTMDLTTLYGKMNFNPNGTRRDAQVYAQQILPVNLNSNLLRYFFSRLAAVNKTNPAVYPLESWEQKELDIYPCPSGSVIDASQMETLATSLPTSQLEARNLTTADISDYCTACPVGRYRHPRSLVCEFCPPGTYGDTEGLSLCHQCPEGADCENVGTGIPEARAGYYKLPLGDMVIQRCDPPEVCLGGNRCLGSSTGVLCESCDAGYAKWDLSPNVKDLCVKCSNPTWNVFMILGLMLFYSLYVWIVVQATASASRSVRAIHSVIMKIFVNYLQFAGTAFEATNFQGLLLDLMGSAGSLVTPLVAVPGLIHNPSLSRGIGKCLLDGFDLEVYQVCILCGLLLLPMVLVLKALFAFVRKELCIGFVAPWLMSRTRRLKVLLGTSREGEIGDASPQLGGEYTPGSRRLRQVCEADRTPGGRKSPYWMAESTPGGRRLRVSDVLTPKRSGMTPGDDTPITPWRSTTGMLSMPASKFMARFVNSSIVVGFVIYPLVIRLLVVGFECKDLDVFRLKYDLSIECTSEEHIAWLWGSSVGLLLYGLGAPLALFILLFVVRSRLFHDDVRKRYGFLYSGFKLPCYYFEAIFMVRKAILVFFFTFPTMYIRMLLMLLASWSFVLLHLVSQPFDIRGFSCLDRLESLNLWALTLTIMSRLAHEMRLQIRSGFYHDVANHWAVSALLVLLPVTAHCWFLSFAAWSLFRNTILKHLCSKQDLWPERMTSFQRCLVKLECHRNKAYVGGEEDFRPWIDVTSLTLREKKFLVSATNETFYRYMCRPGDKVHPTDHTAAIQEAIRCCGKRQRRRSARLQQLYRQQAAVGGFWSTVLRWQAELSLALHGPNYFEEKNDQGCWRALYGWLAEMCFFLHIRSKRAKVPAAAGPAMRSMRAPTLKKMQEEEFPSFYVEDFHDELMLIWQEIMQGRGPRSEVPMFRDSLANCPNFRDRFGSMESTQSCQGLPQGAAGDPSAYGTPAWLENRAGSMSSDHSMSSNEPPRAWHLRDSRGGLAVIDSSESGVFLLDRQGQQDAQDKERSDLQEKLEEMLAENERLRKENEDLRQRRRSDPNERVRTRQTTKSSWCSSAYDPDLLEAVGRSEPSDMSGFSDGLTLGAQVITRALQHNAHLASGGSSIVSEQTLPPGSPNVAAVCLPIHKKGKLPASRWRMSRSSELEETGDGASPAPEDLSETPPAAARASASTQPEAPLVPKEPGSRASEDSAVAEEQAVFFPASPASPQSQSRSQHHVHGPLTFLNTQSATSTAPVVSVETHHSPEQTPNFPRASPCSRASDNEDPAHPTHLVQHQHSGSPPSTQSKNSNNPQFSPLTFASPTSQRPSRFAMSVAASPSAITTPGSLWSRQQKQQQQQGQAQPTPHKGELTSRGEKQQQQQQQPTKHDKPEVPRLTSAAMENMMSTPSLTLPGVMCRSSRTKASSREDSESRASQNSSPLPWLGAMRPAEPGSWSNSQSSFPFMAAARTTTRNGWKEPTS